MLEKTNYTAMHLLC